MNYYAEPRMTRGIDLVVDVRPDDISNLVEALNRLGITFPEACFERTDLNVSDRSENSREDVWNTPGLGACLATAP